LFLTGGFFITANNTTPIITTNKARYKYHLVTILLKIYAKLKEFSKLIASKLYKISKIKNLHKRPAKKDL
jgi:hypothetical protein